MSDTAVQAGQGLKAEPNEPTFANVFRQLRDQWQAGLYRLTHPTGQSILLGLFIGYGVLGDAYTTIHMMSTGNFIEANVIANWVMGHLGVVPVVVVGSLLALCLIIPVLGPVPTKNNLYGSTVWLMAFLIVVLKFFTVTENAAIWAGLDWYGVQWPWTWGRR